MAGNNLKIAIISGGLGGSAAALSLLKAGFDVQVYERGPARGCRLAGRGRYAGARGVMVADSRRIGGVAGAFINS